MSIRKTHTEREIHQLLEIDYDEVWRILIGGYSLKSTFVFFLLQMFENDLNRSARKKKKTVECPINYNVSISLFH